MGKVPKNLLLDEEAVNRADKFTAQHQVSVSQLVSDFLRGLPVEGESRGERLFSPTVRRLIGVAKGEVSVEAYHRHLETKHLG